MGLAIAKSYGVITRPRYEINWEFRADHELKAILEQVFTLLENRMYGPYLVYTAIFRSETANRLASQGECLAQPNRIERRIVGLNVDDEQGDSSGLPEAWGLRTIEPDEASDRGDRRSDKGIDDDPHEGPSEIIVNSSIFGSDDDQPDEPLLPGSLRVGEAEKDKNVRSAVRRFRRISLPSDSGADSDAPVSVSSSDDADEYLPNQKGVRLGKRKRTESSSSSSDLDDLIDEFYLRPSTATRNQINSTSE